MSDVIRLNGQRFYGYHGVSAAEKETGRVFEVDCELARDLADAGQSDRLDDTVDYSAVFEIIKDTVEGRAFNLLEALAARLAARILDSFDIDRVTLRVRKLEPPLPGHVQHVEIEIERRQGDTDKLTGRNEQE